MQRNERNDADWVTGALAGDRQAFGCLYDRYARLVRAVLGGVSMDWPEVEDMTQECFMRAYRNLGKLRNPQRFGPWIVGIARQVARERRRSLRRDRHEFVGTRPPEIEAISERNDPAQDAEELEVLMAKLAKLPEREQLAIHAFFLREHNAQEAASLLALSRSGFYSLLQRALLRLAALAGTNEPKERVRK